MAQLTMEKVRVRAILEEWQGGSHGVYLFDFGDGVTNLPIPDQSSSGSYLNSSVCFVMNKPATELPSNLSLPNSKEPVKDYGNGLKAAWAEFPTHCTPEQLLAALRSAKRKLEMLDA